MGTGSRHQGGPEKDVGLELSTKIAEASWEIVFKWLEGFVWGFP